MDGSGKHVYQYGPGCTVEAKHCFDSAEQTPKELDLVACELYIPITIMTDATQLELRHQRSNPRYLYVFCMQIG